jgi:branched-chain amino acid transport system substrate-binding protein
MSIRANSLVVLLALSAVLVAACGSRVDEADRPATAAAVPTSGTAGGNSANTASDTGVTATDVKVGIVVGKTSPLGPTTFSGSLFGARAYFEALNARGGVNGRKVDIVECDDHGTGPDNAACIRKLVDDDKVFALAGTAAFTYDGASYLSSKGVPDIAGQPITNAYDQYQHLYSIYGSYYPRNGKLPGYNGTLYAGTENYRWLKENLKTKSAGVVYYNVAQSERYAKSIAAGLRKEGFSVVEEQINLGLPNYDAAVLDMKSHGVDVVFDAMEDNGNLSLCKSMQTQKLNVKAKVTTTQGWTDTFGQTFASTPNCRAVSYAISQSRNYNDNFPAANEFRQAMSTYEPTRNGKLNMWTLEGYASAQWLTDGMQSCGAGLTRKCVESYMNSGKDYDGHGLLVPTMRNFTVINPAPKTIRSCINVAQWKDSANGGKGGWADKVADMNTNCFTVPNLPYPAS